VYYLLISRLSHLLRVFKKTWCISNKIKLTTIHGSEIRGSEFLESAMS